MAGELRHRGPDDSGVWSDATAGLFLGHSRLSVLDLSPTGHQPMVSGRGRYVTVFNGEVYNHVELRKEVESASGSVAWRGHSDTEVLLAAIERFGVRGALERTVGMFAFALWDREARELTLARDRVGEKPLYWGCAGDLILFGSELKAIRAHPAFKFDIDRNSLTLLLRYGYISAPYSIYNGIHKAEPASLIRFRMDCAEPEIESYWSAREMAIEAQREPWRGSDAEAAIELERLIRQSVELQLVADVPVGAFLSGGIDSSTVVAVAQSVSSRPIRTFTIGFEEGAYNEAQHAKLIANQLGTDHTELYVSSNDATSIVPRLPQIYDEPFADSSQIPTFLIAKLARKYVTVSLSGDGGDELFAGYTRYLVGEKVSQAVSTIPKAFRTQLARGLNALAPGSWDRILKPLLCLAPAALRHNNIGDKLQKLAAALNGSPSEVYRDLISHWDSPASIVLGANEPLGVASQGDAQPGFTNFVERGAWLDLVGYLPNDILVKLDRAAMAVSLESRIPLLDHRVIEFASRLPFQMKVRNGVGKWILRQVLYKHVPQSLIDRPKMGFSIPLDSWLRGALRGWAEALLDESRIKREGFFDAVSIRKTWQEHMTGERNWHDRLWNVLMFQAWVEENG